ncbi:FadR/GntR family transcriptional regulator [Alkalihalobacillus hemicellulosilyticus]|uniref:Transcriptional regulator n=1 Tax=Halalkalibacter hemicellulosilyticusJCM 9152 TaxID=1236971 RepID=W4QFJ3_9BACI|nr:FCD domain-containing protein [Halalkalibacter hemicellulosilyticus]GAE30109.1 transcriptional regulator [Halalkalibacter hemicellulosilyticusJCM 9152]
MQSKRYLEIITQIQDIIEADRLTEGDRLPSERELSERLGVARSSVREALRALELLEFIETRRGEGTFMKSANSYRLVELLLSFLLKNEKAKQDLSETRRIVEVEAFKLACERMGQEQIERLSQLVESSEQSEMMTSDDYAFHKELVMNSQNRLLTNIWDSLVQYNKAAMTRAVQTIDSVKHNVEHKQIIHALVKGDHGLAVRILKEHLKKSPF